MESLRKSFGQIHFENVNLGDMRRNRRLPQLVDRMLEHPGGTVPEKLSRLADQEAFYRLCDAREVTHAAVLQSHRDLVLKKLQETSSFLLVVHDATELDYSSRESLSRLGQIGNGNGRGYIVQNSLVVDPVRGQVLGLANQVLHTRADVPAKEGVAAKRDGGSRESRLWLKGTEGLPSRSQLVDVCDRGADTFEFLEHELRNQRTFVIRAQHDRRVTVQQGGGSSRQEKMLRGYARSLPALTTSKTNVRLPPRFLRARRQSQGEGTDRFIETYREAKLCLSAAPMEVHAPHVRRGEHGRELLPLWIVRIWEPDPPQGCEPLEWLLFTNYPVTTAAAAKRVASWYEWRWVVEEYHKGLKTGCGIEKLQMRDEERLEPAIAVLSVVALSLLQLRDAARRADSNTRRADDMVDPESIQVLSLWMHAQSNPDWTLHEYYTALAQLGGYRPRKDCPPGWQVLWRGQMKLNMMLEGFRLLQPSPKTVARNQRKKCAKR